MTDINPLIIYPHRLSETPVTIGGDLPMQVLDLAEDDRTAYPNPFSYQLDLTLVNDSVLVRGTLVTVLRRRCDRCLVYYDQPVQIVCMIAAGRDQHDKHIRILAAIAQRMKDESLKEQIVQARSREVIYALMTGEEGNA